MSFFSGSMLLVSCGHMYTKSEGYAESSTAEINGAKVNAAFKPNGGNGGMALSAMVYMAGSATLEGPFLWRIQAEGTADEHQELVIHRVKVLTSKTKRNEWFPQKYLGQVQQFKSYEKTPGVCYAYFQMPGQLKVMPAEDGNVTLQVDLTVKSNKRSVRKVVKFNLVPSTSKDWEFIFLPTEIADSFTPDPRQWKMSSGGYGGGDF